MHTKKRVLSAVAVEVAVLLAVVAFVDTPVIRVGLALVTALLLAQRAAASTAGAVRTPGDLPDRRRDHGVRDHVGRLLACIREFYTACHLARSEKLSTGDATKRVQAIEKDLNRLLAEVVNASRGEAPSSESQGEPTDIPYLPTE